jgi:hypothetical protein
MLTPEQLAQARQLTHNVAAMRARAAKECEAIDKVADRARAGNKYERAARTAPATLHDVAASNPALRALLARVQKLYV